jgi:predicted O-methyltransferase YrrM
VTVSSYYASLSAKVRRLLNALWARRGKVILFSLFSVAMFLAAWFVPIGFRSVALMWAAFLSFAILMIAFAYKMRRYVQMVISENQLLKASVDDARHYADLRLDAEVRAVRATSREAFQSQALSVKKLIENQKTSQDKQAKSIEEMHSEYKAALELTRNKLDAGELQISQLSEEVRRVRLGIEQRMHHEIEDALQASLQDQKEQYARLDAELVSLQQIASADTAFLRFNRVLSQDHIATLKKGWSKRLSTNFTSSSLGYMAQRIRHIEGASNGRLATQIEDAVLRTLVASSSQSRSLEILEIGSLFGVGLTMIYDFVKHRFDEVHLTAIDPLDGYYGANTLDALLQIPVNKENFWDNMRLSGVPENNVTLIDRFSHEDEAIKAASLRQYDVLIIDGDHSYAGIKADFENYACMVKRGGYIIIDDYGSDDWPDVKAYVDAEVAPIKELGLVGIEWRTAVFRVTQKINEPNRIKPRVTSRSKASNSSVTKAQ